MQPTGIRLSGAHMGREFDTLNVPRVGNLTQPLSWKVKDGRTNLLFKFLKLTKSISSLSIEKKYFHKVSF